jgi:formate-dependent phosphoribosylglycinamide formyltransferase (GAR transformylase)
MPTIVIVASCESYRTADFIATAKTLRLDAVIATDAESPFAGVQGQILVDLDDPMSAADKIASDVPHADAIVSVDDQGVRAVALATAALGLSANPPSAADATRDKLVMRTMLNLADVTQPDFSAAPVGDLATAATAIGLPVVIKPISLSASRGVIRMDDISRAPELEARIRLILEDAGRDPAEPLLVERYIDGDEAVVEGILISGKLEVLAIIDKPIPLVGPFFEETMFVSPSRLPQETQDRVIETVELAIAAIGLHTGPIHAEVRIGADAEVYLIEIAARSIGGLCGRSLSFGLLAEPLESIVMRSALGLTKEIAPPSKPATGVMMLPIPAEGVLSEVSNIDEALAISGIDDIELTVVPGRTVRPLPEGDRYVGFVFASGMTPADVERSLAQAAAIIDVAIDGEHVSSGGQTDAASSGPGESVDN